jgi:hypothetical protein
MNVKLALLSIASLLGLSGVAFAQILGNPFATLGIDFYGFFLPWIFTFAIVYGLLIKLGTFVKNINMALAFVVAFFVTAVGGPQLAVFFTSLFGGAAIFLGGILVVLLFAAMIGVDFKNGTKSVVALIVLVIIGVVLFLASSGQFIAVQIIGPGLAGMVFWIIIILVAIYMVVHEGKEQGKGGAGTTE